MLFNVPQYVDIEDKVAGPLTAKQLLWMIGMGAVLLVLWNIFAFGTFVVVAIPVILLFLAFAFYKPYNQPLLFFVMNSVFFLVRPKIYVWSRIPDKTFTKEPVEIKKTEAPEAKAVTTDKIRELAGVLDSRRSVRR